jgi:hypothetical protein
MRECGGGDSGGDDGGDEDDDDENGWYRPLSAFPSVF